MKLLYLVVLLVVAILAVVFALQNSAEVALAFFGWSATGSLSLVVMVTFAIGLVLGVLVMAPSAFRRSVQFSGLKRRMGRLEKEKARLAGKAAEATPDTKAPAETKPAPRPDAASAPEPKPGKAGARSPDTEAR